MRKMEQTADTRCPAPGDLVAILEALKEAGALRAELIVI